MSRVIATNEIKEEFDDVLETPLANFPFDFDESTESAHELQAAQVHCSTTASNNSSPQLPCENDDQKCTAKSNTASDDSMTEVEEEEEIASKPPTGFNQQNLTKRKQSQSKRYFRKSKKTVEDEGEENCQLRHNANRSLVQPTNDINIKQEYEDDEVNNEGTSTNTNQVTVKTELDDEDVKEIIKEEYDEDDHDIFIKQEYVSECIKTESNDEDVIVKDEIKEEDDHDDCEYDRSLVKRELVSDDDNSMQFDDSADAEQVIQADSNLSNDASGDQLNTTANSVFEWAASANEQMQVTNSLVIEQSAGPQVIWESGHQLEQSTQMFQSSDEQANTNEVTNRENGLVNQNEQNEDFNEEEAMSKTANGNSVHSNVELAESSTSAQRQTNPIASTRPTGSNRQNVTKRKQSQANREVKRCKETVEEEGEEDIANEDRDDAKFKVLYLNCTQADCEGKLDSLDQLHGHLCSKHGLAPLQCFCGCKSRFDTQWKIRSHLRGRSASTFSCPSCSKVFSTQHNTYHHWFYEHETGQFQCNIDHCDKVMDTREHLYCHQKHKAHCSESKRHKCPQDGCSSWFVYQKDLKRHQIVHLNTKPFHCKWPKCVYCANQRPNLIRHIRNVHFKKQQENGIVGECDPNKYVQLVKK